MSERNLEHALFSLDTRHGPMVKSFVDSTKIQDKTDYVSNSYFQSNFKKMKNQIAESDFQFVHLREKNESEVLPFSIFSCK